MMDTDRQRDKRNTGKQTGIIGKEMGYITSRYRQTGD